MERAHQINTLIGGLRIAAQCLADRLGVTLAIGGSQACTDGTTIRLPDLPEGSEEAALLARGYLDHEAAHIRFTDFSIPVRPWVNLLEDIRIERLQGQEFPGCAINLRKLVEHLKGRGYFRGDRRNPLSCLMAWACCRGRSLVLNQPLQELALEMETLSRSLFGDGFCTAFAGLIDQTGECRSTSDCEALSCRIEDLIQNPPSADADQGSLSPPDQKPPQGKNPSGDPSASDTDGEGTPMEVNSDSPSDNRHSRTEKEKKNLQRAAAGDGTKAAESVDLGRILKKALDSEHQQSQKEGTLEEIPATLVYRGSQDTDLDPRSIEKALGIDQVRRETAQLRARLAGLLQAKRQRPSYPRQVGQRIESRALHRLCCPTPDLRAFSSRRERIEANTAVLILGDRSGSMSGRKIRLTQQSAYVTAEALELLPGVACAVGFFPWGNQVARLKGFDEKLQASRFTLNASGSTPMAGALLWAGMELTHRREPRKIVVVLTDGQPDDVEATVTALKKLNAIGIECYGIGIQDRSILSWMGAEARIIDKSPELPKALVEVFQSALL